MDTPSPHPDDRTLVAYGEGRLDAAATERIGRHAADCPDCRGRLGALMAARPPAPGSLPAGLAGHPDYRIKRELGRGGMGVVYLAHNELLGRDEVLKVLSRDILERPGAQDRFLREIRAVARLRHPNIVAAYSVSRLGESLVLAMEYVEGLDLLRLVESKGPLPIAHACNFAHQAALGLQHAHERGLIHRDVKPANLMLAAEGARALVKVLDFGLAKARREGGFDSTLTGAGQILGTPDYLAPESILDASNVDVRADVYSLGATLYHLLTGRPPYLESSLYGLYQAHISRDAEPLGLVRADAPMALGALVAKMMAKDPAHRFQAPGEVAEALAPFFKKDGGPAVRRAVAPTPQEAVEASSPGAREAAVPARSEATAPVDLIDIDPGAPSTVATPADEPPRRLAAGRRPAMIAAASLVGLLALGVVAVSPRRGGTAAPPAANARREAATAAPPAKVATGTRSVAKADAGGPPRATSAPPARPAASLSPAVVLTADYVDSKTAKPIRVGGSWEVQGDELVHTDLANQYPSILFGDERWTDYDFSADLMRLDGQAETSILVRGEESSGVARFVVGKDQGHFLEVDEFPSTYRWLIGAPNYPMTPRKWYTARFRVRGDHLDARLLDGDKEVVHVEYDDPKHPRGCVGFYATYASFKYKNLRVTAPDGSLMWEGLPALVRREPPAHRPLFNGKTLSGWTGLTGDGRDVPPEEVFQVVDGTLACRPKAHGAIVTRGLYGDFRFSCEFLAGPRFDSGVRLVPEGDPAGRSLEYQVMGDNSGDQYGAGDVYSHGGLVLDVEPGDRGRTFSHRTRRPTISQADWNRYEIRREGPYITGWINGVAVNRVRTSWAGKWRIGLNAEGNPNVRFRNVEIDENPGPDADPAALAAAPVEKKAAAPVPPVQVAKGAAPPAGDKEDAPARQPAAKAARKAKAPAGDGKPLQEFARVAFPPMTLAFADDGKKLLFTQWAYGVKVFDMETGEALIDKVLYEKPVVGEARDIAGAVFGPDGRMILSYADQVIRVRDRAAEKVREMEPRPLGQVFRDLRYSAPGKWVVGRGATQVGFWDVETGKELRRIDVRAVDLDLHPNGRDVVFIDADHVSHVWNARTGAVTAEFPDASKKIDRARFTPDGRFLLCWSMRGTGVYLVSPGAGEPIQAFLGHAGNVTSAAAFPDRPWVASTSLDRTLRLWDGNSGEPIYEVPYAADAREVVVSPDGRSLVVALKDETIFYRVAAPAARRGR